jgi:hypothetical protein
MGYRAILAAVSALAFSCASTGPRLEMNIEAFSDPEAPIQLGSTFAVVSTGLSGNDLLEKELLYLVKQRLLQKGMKFDDANPQYLVGVVGKMTSSQEYVPPRTAYFPLPGTTTSTTNTWGTVGSIPVSGTSTTSAPTTTYVPITSGGYTRQDFHRVIEILVAKPAPGSPEREVRPVWSGRVISTGSTGDLLLVAPPLLDQLLTEFPRRSGLNPQRVISWAPPGR